MKFKIGTRKSLLAQTQSEQTKKQLESLGEHTFELKSFTTQGDQQTDKALWELEGKDFFTKELDSALLNNEVHLNVHSYKDLGSIRPENIKLAAIPKRQIANDILLIKNSTISTLDKMDNFVIGTSSPRRKVNLLKSIQNFIPNGKNLTFSTEILRGNVNTRIEKLLEGKYDAIVLAFAGIERLASSPKSQDILKELLIATDTNYMILPQLEFPSAASQGALAIEKNSTTNNQQLDQVLQTIHHQKTATEVEEERKLFNKYGGGCHLAVGIHVAQLDDGMIVIQKGELEQKQISDVEFKCSLRPQLDSSHNNTLFFGVIGHKYMALNDQLISKEKLNKVHTFKNKNILITSTHCIDSLDQYKRLENCHLFTGGMRTWRNMAAKGYWINGCGDIEGEKELAKLAQTNLFQLYSNEKSWTILSNNEATSSLGEITPCYKRTILQVSDQYIEKINHTDIFYWSSFFQYKQFLNLAPSVKDKIHCCGLGKTLQQFKNEKILVYPFLNGDDYYNFFTL